MNYVKSEKPRATFFFLHTFEVNEVFSYSSTSIENKLESRTCRKLSSWEYELIKLQNLV